MTPDGFDNDVDFTPFTPEDVEQSVPARFESRACRYPDRIAIRTQARCVTYRQLHSDVDRIARAVSGARGPHSEPVALLVGDDIATIASMLAVMKAGKIFVPLDPAQPDARAALVLEDSGALLIVTDSRHRARARTLASHGVDVFDIDAPDGAVLGDTPASLPPETPACILYTSGSTGRPKGVLQSHRTILHNILIHTNALEITPRDRLTLLSSRGTGQAMTGIFSALLNGAALHPFDLRAKGLTGLAAWLVEDEITIYHSSATVFRDFVDLLNSDVEFPALRVVKLGSEPVSKKDVDRFRERFGLECVFVNALSSTETGTIRQYVIGRETPIASGIVPVGYPVPDVDVMLLDDDGNSVETGGVGEICVRSRYLALGFWQSPELTRAVFLPDRDGGDARVFRTGDLGRMAADGCLECLGRKDSRVKIRGNRVEVAEIEVALLESGAVRQVAVVDRDDGRGRKLLVAYAVPAAGPMPSVRGLRAYLSERLPRHMVPSAFVFLDELPLTPGRKVDRQALPAWEPRAVRSGNAVLPRGLLETQLAEIWKRLLGVPDIGVRDDFFELGGDSLLAVEMAIRVEEACGVIVPIQHFLTELTIEMLARVLVDPNSGQFKSPLVELQSAGSNRPFFFAHGAIEGGGFYCRNLARHLGAEQPFYVLHPHGLNGEPVPRSIEEMAADRLDALLAVQPSGPYLLGGYCGGGLVAFEMARRLQERGHRVDLVLLIDAHAHNAPVRAWSPVVNTLEPLFRLGPDARRTLLRRLRSFHTGLRRASAEGGTAPIRFILKKPYSILRGVSKKTSAASRPPASFGDRQAVWLAYHNAIEDYVPKPYAGRVVLFRTNHLEDRVPGDRGAGWQYVCGDVEVHDIPGDHNTCITRHVEELAAKMRASLRVSTPPAA
jgi:amino acid adenylation domain-containing protein